MNCRIETDLLGKKEIPAGAYWGIHTQRALENFTVKTGPVPSILIKSIVLVKKACCISNMELGYIDNIKGGAIVNACDEILGGALPDQFPLDAMQGGAGTST
ncbi:MAG TPA: aspartate ammonia-lyase, partial [Fibrobacteres bacterium]|nr:aspartate ammonia-lyase [Fibrobacterota bacterium]